MTTGDLPSFFQMRWRYKEILVIISQTTHSRYAQPLPTRFVAARSQSLCRALPRFRRPGCRRAAAGPRKIIPFDTGWRFHLGDDPAARQPGFDDASWRTLDLPHDWSVEGPLARPPEGEGNGGFFTHGIGWYRKAFTLPAARGQKVIIEFDGVYMNSEVWINGQFLGRRPYGFVGFRYDLTDFLKTDGSPNVLAVRVDDSLEPSLALVCRLRHLPPCAAHHHQLHPFPAGWRHHHHHAGDHPRSSHRRGHRHH